MDITFYHADLKVFIPIVGGLAGFAIFWFTQNSEKLKASFIKKYGHDIGYAKFVIYTRYLGAFSIGILPFFAFVVAFPETTLSELGLGIQKETILSAVLWSLGLMAIIVPLTAISARKPENLINYPQIRAKEWNRRMISGNLLAWAVYLLGYEFLFRGVLLFPLVEGIGLWPAIAVNIGMYSGTHIPKGLKETLAAIPFSVVLCLLTIHTGSIWIAYFVHVAMAWTNSLTSLKLNPEMKIVKKQNNVVTFERGKRHSGS